MSDNEIALIVSQLDQLMGELRVTVDALQAIILSEPEVPGGQPATA